MHILLPFIFIFYFVLFQIIFYQVNIIRVVNYRINCNNDYNSYDPKVGENPTYYDETQYFKVVGLFELEELAKYLPFRKVMYKKKKYVNIHDFDIAICRPYFHVKPLEYELHRI